MEHTIDHEPFETYADLVAVQETPDGALLAQLTEIGAQAGIEESALAYGALIAAQSEIARTQPDYTDTMRTAYTDRLRTVAGFLLERGGEPLNDDRLYDVQVALGNLAGGSIVDAPPQVVLSVEQQPVNYTAALQNLRRVLAGMQPGEQYSLSPSQVLSLAGSDMAFSRWQRYRLLRAAREQLSAEGYVFTHNNGRGRSSLYTVGITTEQSAQTQRTALPTAA